MNETVKTMAEAVRKVTDFRPRIALTLGSGLGNFASCIRTEVSTAPGHAGKLIFGWLDDVPLVCMQGRVHLYEGYTPEEVVRPVRLCRALGAETLFLTNAAGGLDASWEPGTLAMGPYLGSGAQPADRTE